MGGKLRGESTGVHLINLKQENTSESVMIHMDYWPVVDSQCLIATDVKTEGDIGKTERVWKTMWLKCKHARGVDG